MRPFNLGWRSDFGLAYICEPEELLYLCQLIVTNGSLGYGILNREGVFATLILDWMSPSFECFQV